MRKFVNWMGTLPEYYISPFFDTEDTLEIKRYCYQLLKKMKDDTGLKMSIVQFRKNPIFKDKLKLVRDSNEVLDKKDIIRYMFLEPKTEGLYFSNNGEIMLLLDNTIRNRRRKLKLNNKNGKLLVPQACTFFRHAIHHEIRHEFRDKQIDSSLGSILIQLEEMIRMIPCIGGEKYKFQHDSFFMEIDANIYGIRKTISDYEDNPDKKHFDSDFLMDIKRRYEYKFLTYDFDSMFTLYNNFRNVSSMNILNMLFSEYTNTTWYQVFYGDRKRLKTVKEIIEHKDFNKIDLYFIYHVFSSQYFNKNLDYNLLDYNSLEILCSSFLAMITLTEKKIKLLKNNNEHKPKDIKILKKKLLFYQKKYLEVLSYLNVDLNDEKKGPKGI